MSFGASIKAVFGADTGPLQASAAQAGNVVQGFTSKAASLLSAVGVTLGAGAVAGFFKTVIDKAGKLSDLSDRLGVSTDALQSFDYAVRLAGGSSNDATAVWDKAKKSLDQLAAGEETATKQFAALGLHAADFIGLDLPKSLELVARGYANNTDRAGAFDAVTDILGTRTAPRLNSVLLRLAGEGFGGLEEAADKAGQMIGSEAVQNLDRFADRLGELLGRIAPVAAAVLNIAIKSVDGLGMIAAAVVNTFDGIETSVKRSDFIAEAAGETVKRMLPALERTTAELKVQGEIEKERQRIQDLLAKQALDEANHAGKVALLKREIAAAAERAFAVGADALTTEKELFKFASLQGELRKVEAAEKERILNATRLGREEELEYFDLTRRAARGLTDAERLRLENLNAIRKEKLLHVEIDELLKKGVDELTREERARLEALVNQSGEIQKLIASQKEILESTIARTAAEGGNTEELQKQLATLERQGVVLNNNLALIKKGEGPERLTDRELKERGENLRRQIQEEETNVVMWRGVGVGGRPGNPYMTHMRNDLANVEREMATRRQFRSYFAAEGEAALLRYSAFEEERFRGYVRPEDEKRAADTLATLKEIRAQLRSAGLSPF